MFRPMRRGKQEISFSECEGILSNMKRGVLSVMGDDGFPYGTPTNYIYLDKKIYLHCALEGKKVDSILLNNKASFCVMDKGYKNEGEWYWHVNSVIVLGTIKIIDDPQLKLKTARALGEKYFPTQDEYEKTIAKHLDKMHMLELTPLHITGKHVTEK